MHRLNDVNRQLFVVGVKLRFCFFFISLLILRCLRVLSSLYLSGFVELSSQLLDLLLLSSILFFLKFLCPLSLWTVAIIVIRFILVSCGEGMLSLDDVERRRRFRAQQHLVFFFP